MIPVIPIMALYQIMTPAVLLCFVGPVVLWEWWAAESLGHVAHVWISGVPKSRRPRHTFQVKPKFIKVPVPGPLGLKRSEA